MGQRTHLRLHMGCGEALTSRLAVVCERRRDIQNEPGRGTRALTSRYADRTRGGNKHS